MSDRLKARAREIADAPRDGTYILAYCGPDELGPSHWMPLPTPPKESGNG